MVFNADVFNSPVFNTTAGGGGGGDTDLVGFRLFRNGVEEVLQFHNHHYGQMQFTLAAFDGEVGMGSIAVPGELGWIAGDRISLMPLDIDKPFYTGYLTSSTRERDPVMPTEIVTTWQLMDINRQGIGRTVQAVALYDDFIKDLIEGEGPPEPTIDGVTWVDGTYASTLPTGLVYTGDGWMNLIQDIINYSGYTVYLGLSPTENTFYLHIHALSGGGSATVTVSDDPDDLIAANSFAPKAERRTLDVTDLKDDIIGRNQISLAPGEVAVHLHADGGLRWQAYIDAGVNDADLVLIVNNILNSANLEKPTYAFTIGPLTSEDLLRIPAGSQVPIKSTVLGYTGPVRASHLTIRVTQDAGGNFLPGLWDVDIEGAYPLRLPTQTNLGLQGSPYGGFIIDNEWNGLASPRIDDEDLDVGDSTTVTTQLIFKKRTAPDEQDAELPDTGEPIAVDGVTVYWAIREKSALYEYGATDYALTASTSVTDKSGSATNVVTRTGNTGTTKWKVIVGSEPIS